MLTPLLLLEYSAFLLCVLPSEEAIFYWDLSIPLHSRAEVYALS